jgi:hypothetical protein
LAGIAAAAGIIVDRRDPAWGFQYDDSGFTPAEQAAANHALAAWVQRLATTPPASAVLVRHFNKPRTAPYLRITVGTEDDARG